MLGLDNPIHIAFILVLLLLVFGAKRLPEMGRSLGEGLRGFKDSISGESATAHLSEAPVTVTPVPAQGAETPTRVDDVTSVPLAEQTSEPVSEPLPLQPAA